MRASCSSERRRAVLVPQRRREPVAIAEATLQPGPSLKYVQAGHGLLLSLLCHPPRPITYPSSSFCPISGFILQHVQANPDSPVSRCSAHKFCPGLIFCARHPATLQHFSFPPISSCPHPPKSFSATTFVIWTIGPPVHIFRSQVQTLLARRTPAPAGGCCRSKHN